MMRKTIFLTMSLAIPCCAQEAPQNVAYQQPGWIAAPGSTQITVHITKPDGQTGPVRGKPFSATEVHTTKQILSDGNHIDRTDTSKFYRDAEGRTRDEGEGHLLIFDPVGGATYQINPQAKTYEKWSAGSEKSTTTIVAMKSGTWIDTTNQPGAGQAMLTVPKEHVPYHSEPVRAYQKEDLGEENLNGVLCKGTRTTMTIPVNAVGNAREIKVVDERWYSEDLGALVKSSTNDPRFGVSTYELTNILRTDPDVSLFQVPADYVLKQRSY
jgi:hypothetical protein